jgi:cobalamin-dependent methionine synthase I
MKKGQADTATGVSKSARAATAFWSTSWACRHRTSSSTPMCWSSHGMEEHRNYAVDFFQATRIIKDTLPGLQSQRRHF